MSRKTTEPHNLKPNQLHAIAELVAGRTVTQAAEAAGVGRETVSRWRNRDPTFIAELSLRRSELWDGHFDKLRALVPDAIEALAELLKTGEPNVRLRAAGMVLDAMKHANPGPPIEAEEVETQQRTTEADRMIRAMCGT